MHKMNLLIMGLALTITACGGDSPTPGNTDPEDKPNEVTGVSTVTSGNLIDLATDKACYKPGDIVTFTAAEIPASATIRYRNGAKVIHEEKMGSSKSWTWAPPSTDFTGYMVDIYTKSGNEETIYGTIAVDVSSDWTKFPRYGFVATFDDSKLPDGVIESEMEYLNRCHINGVQFQDWHNKHHWPLGGTRTRLDAVYKDIANRDVYTSVVKKYIEVQHNYGMKSIFYNLCFGALDDAASDGVKEQWYAFKNSDHSNKDYHSLPSNWKSNIFLLDPANREWQAYIGDRNDDVYANFDFDGYQIDQLGNRGTLYDYYGNKLNLPKGYASFINAMKKRHPEKRLVMNAVSSYGASLIAGTGQVDFCYNETWSDEDQFKDLHTIIKANDQYSKNTLKTVFASYMNYDLADRTTGYMNTPGVILTDAVMMALGGAHLELGDHMLSREYFPASPLAMNKELRTAMVRYYDFMTAYENILRDGTSANEYTADIKSTAVSINAWPPKVGSVTAYAKNVGTSQVVHLLNFLNVEDLSWRDLNGTRKAPKIWQKLPVTVNSSKSVKKVWVASPDYHGGVPQELEFKQSGTKLQFVVPALMYWTMIVME